MTLERTIKKSARREALTRVGKETRTVPERTNAELARIMRRVAR